MSDLQPLEFGNASLQLISSTISPGWEQLDLWGGDYRTRLERVRDRGRIWQAYCDCLTLERARAALPDIPEADWREVWPDRCPLVPDESLDRRLVMEAVQELGPDQALAYLAEGCLNLDWLRSTIREFSP